MNIEYLIRKSRKTAFCLTMLLSGNPKGLSLVRRIIHASAYSNTVAPQNLNDVKLAVTEACTNIIKHAFNHDQKQRFELFLEVSPELMLVRLKYTDPKFYPETIPQPNFSEIHEGGLGVFIIRNIMDHVRYSKVEKKGLIELRMIKFLNTRREGKSVSEDSVPIGK